MAFEKLAPPEFSAIRKPTAQEIAEVMGQAEERFNAAIPSTANQRFHQEVEEWPAGTQCECKRNRKDGSKCGHIWKTRTPGKPNACAKCKQTCWDEVPTQRKRHKVVVIKRKRANKNKVGKSKA